MGIDLTVLAAIKATLAKAREPALISSWWRQTYAYDVAALVAALPAACGEAPGEQWVEVWGRDEGCEVPLLFFKIPAARWDDETDGRLRAILAGCHVTDVELRHVGG